MSFYQSFSSGRKFYHYNGPNKDFEVMGNNVTANINGVNYVGKKSIYVSNGVVFVDGTSQGEHAATTNRIYNVTITGDRVESVNTAGSATVNGNRNKLSSGGSANVVGDVQHLSAGGSATVSGNAGNVSAGGSVNVGKRGW
jgi:hypothetical protein